ncbi:Ribonuclease J [Candidatus Bilamarchaeum dharawalense]|uniref:Ribonuclease J n=1 Tax=Candidatus Bilamarchaeum dharawalense TaxID=2885759 RepID=A0A5E4LT64_9ARCH|nr:Ribonuclease J [Candidatus Bilamarchaeum dharawalense]
MEFFVDCLGASREVGRSAFMLRTDKNILLDYGIKIFDESNLPKFPLETSLKPDMMLLSHAHLDHSGCIPALYRDNKITWYSTPPTKDICEILWLDSMKIMGDGLPYRLGHFNKALKHWDPLLYKKPIQTGQTRIELFDAGHISGASMIDIEYKGKTFFYTGDFKCDETMMHKGAKFIDGVDTLMIESTYAQKDHPPRKEVEQRLMEEIYDTLESGGNVLLPSFALGRTQELIALIRSYDENVPVYVDGMGKEISRIYMQYPSYIKDPEKFKRAIRSVNLVAGIPDKKAATRQPSVIITSSGMMNGGPVLNYLFNLNSNSKIILTGYCVEGTNGNTLLNQGFITQDGEQLQVDLPIEYLDLSAHAGRTDLIKFIKKAGPEKVLLVHGDHPEEFAKELKEQHGFDALAPLPGERVILDEEK